MGTTYSSAFAMATVVRRRQQRHTGCWKFVLQLERLGSLWLGKHNSIWYSEAQVDWGSDIFSSVVSRPVQHPKASIS